MRNSTLEVHCCSDFIVPSFTNYCIILSLDQITAFHMYTHQRGYSGKNKDDSYYTLSNFTFSLIVNNIV